MSRFIIACVQVAGRLCFKNFWLKGALPRHACLVFSNHSSWWDGFLWKFLILNHFGRKVFNIMDAGELAEKPFLAGLGAIGIDRTNSPFGIRKLIAEMNQMMEQHQDAIFVFYPQGKIFPSWISSFETQRGYQFLEKNLALQTYSGFLHVEWLNGFRKQVFFLLEPRVKSENISEQWLSMRKPLFGKLSMLGESAPSSLVEIGFVEVKSF
jgi:hypothetical protein